MAQFTIRWPNGAEVTFEGDVSFRELRDLLDGDPPPLLEVAVPAARPPRPAPHVEPDREVEDSGSDDLPRVDFGYLNARLEEVGARTDVERVTVLAQAAIDAGARGLDIATAENWFRELALRMPGVWRSTFTNAQARGYLRREGRGLWRPTSAGTNFALRGERKPSPARRRPRRTRQEATTS